MFEQIITYLKSLDKISIILIILFIIFLIFMFVKKQYKISIEAIRKAETLLNSGEGQKKLDYAVNYIQLKLPIILKPFMTKKLIVSIIEYLLNKGLQHMGSKDTVDIKGNEGE